MSNPDVAPATPDPAALLQQLAALLHGAQTQAGTVAQVTPAELPATGVANPVALPVAGLPVAPPPAPTPPKVGSVIAYTWTSPDDTEQTSYGIVIDLLAGDSQGQALVSWLPPGHAQLHFDAFTVL